MTSLSITTSLLGLGLAIAIFYLVRRDRLHLAHGVFWLSIAALAGVLGIWPSLIDRLAVVAGVSYPPALLFLVAVIILLIKGLLGDIEQTQTQRELRRLNQRLAIHETDIRNADEV